MADAPAAFPCRSEPASTARATPAAARAPHQWDATAYDHVSDPHVRWGNDVAARLRLAGHETVVDAGCGTGRVTELLCRRLPRGRVIAVDASAAMLAAAARRLAPVRDRVALVRADLRRPLPIGRPVDAVFSTATFHWIEDHDALFRQLAAVLRPGGQLVAQCGGAGTIASVREALRQVGDGWTGPWTFATAAETRRRLEAAGFVAVDTWLQAEPVALEPGAALEQFLATVILGAHLARLPASEHGPFVRAVAARLPHPERPVIDYVRLNIVARRA